MCFLFYALLHVLGMDINNIKVLVVSLAPHRALLTWRLKPSSWRAASLCTEESIQLQLVELLSRHAQKKTKNNRILELSMKQISSIGLPAWSTGRVTNCSCIIFFSQLLHHSQNDHTTMRWGSALSSPASVSLWNDCAIFDTLEMTWTLKHGGLTAFMATAYSKCTFLAVWWGDF